jgi:hypothetical protein
MEKFLSTYVPVCKNIFPPLHNTQTQKQVTRLQGIFWLFLQRNDRTNKICKKNCNIILAFLRISYNKEERRYLK